jgi:citrate synthase
MRRTARDVLGEIDVKDDPLLDVAIEPEKIALRDDYYVEEEALSQHRLLFRITLKAMGFSTSMFTVLFAVARTVGWIAQWKEMIVDPAQKIGRPRQLYTGATKREYKPMGNR